MEDGGGKSSTTVGIVVMHVYNIRSTNLGNLWGSFEDFRNCHPETRGNDLIGRAYVSNGVSQPPPSNDFKDSMFNHPHLNHPFTIVWFIQFHQPFWLQILIDVFVQD